MHTQHHLSDNQFTSNYYSIAHSQNQFQVGDNSNQLQEKNDLIPISSTRTRKPSEELIHQRIPLLYRNRIGHSSTLARNQLHEIGSHFNTGSYPMPFHHQFEAEYINSGPQQTNDMNTAFPNIDKKEIAFIDPNHISYPNKYHKISHNNNYSGSISKSTFSNTHHDFSSCENQRFPMRFVENNQQFRLHSHMHPLNQALLFDDNNTQLINGGSDLTINTYNRTRTPCHKLGEENEANTFPGISLTPIKKNEVTTTILQQDAINHNSSIDKDIYLPRNPVTGIDSNKINTTVNGKYSPSEKDNALYLECTSLHSQNRLFKKHFPKEVDIKALERFEDISKLNKDTEFTTGLKKAIRREKNRLASQKFRSNQKHKLEILENKSSVRKQKIKTLENKVSEQENEIARLKKIINDQARYIFSIQQAQNSTGI